MLIKYLSNMYDGFKEDHKSFDMFIVADFIDSAQMDTEEAEENCYPKWSMRGNI